MRNRCLRCHAVYEDPLLDQQGRCKAISLCPDCLSRHKMMVREMLKGNDEKDLSS